MASSVSQKPGLFDRVTSLKKDLESTQESHSPGPPPENTTPGGPSPGDSGNGSGSEEATIAGYSMPVALAGGVALTGAAYFAWVLATSDDASEEGGSQ